MASDVVYMHLTSAVVELFYKKDTTWSLTKIFSG